MTKQQNILLCVIFLALGYWLGMAMDVVEAPQASSSERADLTEFWEAWDLLDTQFVNTTGEPLPTSEERVWGAIEGLVGSYGDPHTRFLPPQAATAFTEETLGNFGGVGMEIDQGDEGVVVVAPIKGTPAALSGVRTGDIIIEIDGEPATELSLDDAVMQIRGEVGTDVVITMYRPETDEVLDFTITRALIAIPTVESELRADGIFVIRIFNFSGSIVEHFRDAIRAFLSSGSDKLILDLRGNPGGFLDAAVDVASWFLPLGKTVVREVSGEDELVHRSKGYGVVPSDTQMVVLIDGGSASGSELLAGALQEEGRATLIGETTFGKGSVQQLINVTPETLLRLTVAKWLTPGGISISEGGLEPDITVPFSIEDFEAGMDPQMDAAVELLL